MQNVRYLASYCKGTVTTILFSIQSPEIIYERSLLLKKLIKTVFFLLLV